MKKELIFQRILKAIVVFLFCLLCLVYYFMFSNRKPEPVKQQLIKSEFYCDSIEALSSLTNQNSYVEID